MEPGLVAAIVGGTLAIIGVLVWNFLTRRSRCQRFKERPDLSLEQVYAQFFAHKNLPKDLTLELWTEVAQPLGVSPGKLRPEDRFGHELAPPKGWEWDDDIVAVQWAAERRLKNAGVKADLSAIKTLGDYIEFFCDLATRRQGV